MESNTKSLEDRVVKLMSEKIAALEAAADQSEAQGAQAV